MRASSTTRSEAELPTPSNLSDFDVVIASDSGLTDGGSSKVAVTTALALQERGHRVGFFGGTAVDERLTEAGIAVASLGAKRLSQETDLGKRLEIVVGNQAAAREFGGLLDRFDPSRTVVHVHTFASLISSASISVAFDRGFPTILTCHDYIASCPNGAFYRFPQREICRIEPLSAACASCRCTDDGMAGKAARVIRGFIDARLRHTIDRFDRIVFVSNFSRAILEAKIDVGERGVVLYNPCDVPKIERVDVTGNRPVLWLGRLVPEKDPVLLATAAKAAGVPAVFCGDGPLRSEVASANPDAEITGWVSADEVQARARAARALVMTSRWYEAAPLVAPEALAAGLPVLVPDTCAAREFIADDETGLIFRSGDADDLARALAAVSDNDLAERMSRNAYDLYWRDPLTMDRHLAGLTEIYATTLLDKRLRVALG